MIKRHRKEQKGFLVSLAAAAALALPIAGAGSAMASPTVIVDTTPGGAVVDGTVNAGEYVGSSTGINSGFGGQLSPGPLSLDSDSSGNVQLGLDFAFLKDFVIVYFDLSTGGVSGTDVLADNTDEYRAAAAGLSIYAAAGGDLFFAPGFEADLALAVDYNGAQLFDISSGSLTLLGSPTVVFSPSYDAMEIDLPSTMTGISPGDSFDYIATLGSPFWGTAFARSDEFHGVDPATVPSGNPIHATVSLADGDFNTFTSFAGAGGTIAAQYTCAPSSGTVPFNTSMTVTLDNLYTGQTRRIAGRIDLTLAGGTTYGNWRAGYTNVAAGSSYTTSWMQSIPALGTLIGNNTFLLLAEDVTPVPYNQPPYPAAGDTASASCVITGIAP